MGSCFTARLRAARQVCEYPESEQPQEARMGQAKAHHPGRDAEDQGPRRTKRLHQQADGDSALHRPKCKAKQS